MMKVLVDLKADVNKADPDGNTPLLLAVMQDHVPSIKVLLDNHVDTEGLGPEGYRPLAVAIVEDKYEAAKALVDGGAKVNVPGGPEAITPLMEAAAQKAPALGAVFLPDSTRPVDVGRALLEHGADINAKSTSGITPLMVAATHNNAPMIGLLIEAGADGTAKNNEGKTAHDLAVLNGNLEAAQAILVLSAVPPTNAAASPANGSGSTSQ
jgi:ankyrin repeat protein